MFLILPKKYKYFFFFSKKSTFKVLYYFEILTKWANFFNNLPFQFTRHFFYIKDDSKLADENFLKHWHKYFFPPKV